MAIVLAVPRSPHVAKLIRFPPDIWERFEAALRRERRSVTAQVVWLVERWLDEQDREREERERREPPRVAEDGEGYRPGGA